MSKPVCKSESRWLFWRYDNYHSTSKRRTGFAKWMRKQMNRARRRFYKKEAEGMQ